MKAKEIFNLAVRLLGLVFLYHGLRIVPSALAQIFESFPHQLTPHAYQPMNFASFVSALFAVGWPLFVAQWLMRGAPLVRQIAYPETSGPAAESALGKEAEA